MIGKKINQLATELAPESTDLTIIGDPTTGVSKKITLAQLGAIFSGAVSFYNDLASFPATGDINVIYCAKDTKKLYLWTGSAYVEVFPSQALLDTYQLRSEKGNANGYASLDSQGKVPISQLPSSIMEYKGTWNAATNTPTLANGTGDTGDVYICNVAGTVNFGAGPITFAVGDYVIYSGTIWQRSSGAVGTVTSVAASITGDSVTISGSPVTTSGTLAFAFAGTGAQYIKGDGTLATFPTTIDQAKNLITEVYNSTGATLTKGTVVYINGGQGNLPTVTKALASGDSTSAQTYGIVQADITNMNNGFVVVAGRLADIDTSAFSVGTQLYLSSTTAGAYTSTKQYAPAHLVYVGIIVRSHPTQGIIEVKIQNGYELDELHNVAAQTPTNNDGLFWESSTSLWKNKSIATVLGYTPANAATYVPYTGATANVDLGAFDLLSRSAYLEGTASYQAGLLIKQRGLYNFVTGAYTQIVADSATDLNIVHNQANTTRRRYALSVAALQDGDTFQYLLPRANGTFALTSDLTGGTVTSVAALTIGTSGTDLSSTVANSTTTPVITLNVPTASATNRGALSSTDWTTFNNKQNALTNPVTGTGNTNYLPKFTGTSAIGNSAIYDNSGNIGIGTTSANTLLSLVGNHAGGQSILKIQSSTAYSSSGLSSIGFNDSDGSRKAIIYTNTNGLQLETGTATPIIFNPNGTTALTLANGGAATFSSTLQATNIGINFAPQTDRLFVYNGSGTNTGITVQQDGTGDIVRFNGNIGANRLVLQQGGNLGLGVTPSAWRNLFTALQVGYTGALYSTTVSTAGEQVNLASNYYQDSAGNELRIQAGYATRYQQASGEHRWSTAGTSTAGSGISFTQAMTLNASGNLSLGNTNDTYKLDVSGTSYFRGLLSVNTGSVGTLCNISDGIAQTFRVTTTSTGFDISNPNEGYISFSNATERLRITSGGNVGIGTTSPGEKLTVNGTIGLQNSGTQNWGIYTTSTNNIVFQRSGIADRMVITSDGNVGIGTTSPQVKLDLQNGNVGFYNNTASSGGAQLYLGDMNFAGGAYATSAPGIGSVYSSALGVAGDLAFYTYGGVANSRNEVMRIKSGNVGIGTTSPGSLLDVVTSTAYDGVIRVRSTGTNTPVVAMGVDAVASPDGYVGTQNNVPFGIRTNDVNRIWVTTAGNVGIGTTSPLQTATNRTVLTINGTSSNVLNFGVGGTLSAYIYSDASDSGLYAQGNLYLQADGAKFTAFVNNSTERMRIFASGNIRFSSQVYGNTVASPRTLYIASDGELGGISSIRASKTNINQLDTSWLMQLNPVSFNYRKKNENGDYTNEYYKELFYGLIAEETELVNKEICTYNDNKLVGIEYSKLVPVLVKAIQQLKQELDTLKNK